MYLFWPLRVGGLLQHVACLSGFFPLARFDVPVRGCMCQCPVAFDGRMTFHRLDGPHFISPCIRRWTCGLFPPFVFGVSDWGLDFTAY